MLTELFDGPSHSKSRANYLYAHITKVPCYSSSNAIIVCLQKEKGGGWGEWRM